jgi:hypothetical protein
MKLMEYLGVIYKAFISCSKPKRSYSQYSEDLIIQSYYPRGKRDGCYVDVGAIILAEDPIYGLYKRLV